jgi:hypothetical protein
MKLAFVAAKLVSHQLYYDANDSTNRAHFLK